MGSARAASIRSELSSLQYRAHAADAVSQIGSTDSFCTLLIVIVMCVHVAPRLLLMESGNLES